MLINVNIFHIIISLLFASCFCYSAINLMKLKDCTDFSEHQLDFANGFCFNMIFATLNLFAFMAIKGDFAVFLALFPVGLILGIFMSHMAYLTDGYKIIEWSTHLFNILVVGSILYLFLSESFSIIKNINIVPIIIAFFMETCFVYSFHSFMVLPADFEHVWIRFSYITVWRNNLIFAVLNLIAYIYVGGNFITLLLMLPMGCISGTVLHSYSCYNVQFRELSHWYNFFNTIIVCFLLFCMKGGII